MDQNLTPQQHAQDFPLENDNVAGQSRPTIEKPNQNMLDRSPKNNNVAGQSGNTIEKPNQAVQDRSLENIDVAGPTVEKLTLALHVRRTLIGVSSLVAVVSIACVTAFFEHGVKLTTYNGAGMTQTERDKLLDKWNGYSGTVASVIGRPLEMVITMMTRLLVLRFLTNALLQTDPKGHVAKTTVIVSTVLGFLLNNGFNALNMQLRDGGITAVIKASDLKASTPDNAMNLSAISNITQTFSEMQENNSIANTVLRGVVMPRARKALPQCDPSARDLTTTEDSVSYGFQVQDWMKLTLPSAPEASTLRVFLNATGVDANEGVKGADLPMNASRAADLFVIASIVSQQYIPWGKMGEWNESIPRAVLHEWTEGSTIPTGIAAGLLPPKVTASELEQRNYFFRAIQFFFDKRAMNTSVVLPESIQAEFAHVDISPLVTIDAMTWRVELKPTLLNSATLPVSNSTTKYAPVSCGPWPGVCSLSKLDIDPPMVVHAFSACANEDGSESLRTLPFPSKSMRDLNIQCPRRSNVSMILLSTSRRLIADAIWANTSVNASMLVPKIGHFAVRNPRKFYEFTVSRLSWAPQDLATKFHARCEPTSGCMGLFLDTSHNKSLVTGLENLPLSTLRPIAFNIETKSHALSPYRLISVNEPPFEVSTSSKLSTGDFILAHNVGSNNMGRARMSGTSCSTSIEDRQQLVLNNHMYMESTLQATYTAGVFFLFQDAALRDKATLGTGKLSLTFDGNTPRLSLWISIPTWNALLTGAGCLLLVLGLVSAMVWSSRGDPDVPDSMGAITTPQVIARVMLDDTSFPPSIVRRLVTADPRGDIAQAVKTAASLVEDFLIQSLTLRPRNETPETAARFVSVLDSLLTTDQRPQGEPSVHPPTTSSTSDKDDARAPVSIAYASPA